MDGSDTDRYADRLYDNVAAALREMETGNSAFVTRVSSRLDARAGGVSFL